MSDSCSYLRRTNWFEIVPLDLFKIESITNLSYSYLPSKLCTFSEGANYKRKVINKNVYNIIVPHLKVSAMQKMNRYKLFQKYTRFLVLRFYGLGFEKYFDLVLLIPVPLIACINLVEPIIRITRCCLERQPTPPQCSLRVVDWSSSSQYPTLTRTLWRRRVCVRALSVYLRVLEKPP